MLIRLFPSSSYAPPIRYGLAFPNVLPLYDLGPGATMPAAWSSQLQILSSVLELETPSSIHMLDRAVGLVARVREVSMHMSEREIVVKFVDGREVVISMNSDCVQILSRVAVDFKRYSELTNARNSMEDSVCSGGTTGSVEIRPSRTGSTKSPKLGKHKRQRSLLFSLISSLVPKSLSLSSPPPPSGGPPPAPLPPLPKYPSKPTNSARPDPVILCRKVQAALVDTWRRYVIPTLPPQHLPAAGYVEWILTALASQIQEEIESVGAVKSQDSNLRNMRGDASRHRKTQSESRNAFDLGDRRDDCELGMWRCRAPSPFPDMLNVEDTDRVVYPRKEQADEWGVRHVHHLEPSGETDVFSVGYDGHSDNLLDQRFVGDEWDDAERPPLGFNRTGCHNSSDMYSCLSSLEDKHLPLVDFGLDCSGNGDDRLADMVFGLSKRPLTPDISGDEESVNISLRTPEDEDLPLALATQKLQGSTQRTSYSSLQSPLVSRISSSRPRSRNASAQYSSEPSVHVQAPCPSAPSTPPSPDVNTFDRRDPQVDRFIASRFAYLEQIYGALEVVQSRAREEGWRSVRATFDGGGNEWLDGETERSLEIKAKRRAWSSGVKIPAPYPSLYVQRRSWGGTFLTFRSPTMAHGLTSRYTEVPEVRGPIVPTGLSLGIPIQSSPLAMYSWSADDGQRSAPIKYGILHSVRKNAITGRRSSRVSLADNITTLFPVCEDDNEDAFEPAQTTTVGFPQAVAHTVSEEPSHDLSEGPAENEDDPFHFCPSRPRTRTTSMYMTPPTPSVGPPSVPPLSRRASPPPCYEVVVGGGVSAAANDENGRLDASTLLLQPFSPLSISSSLQSLSRPISVSNPTFVSRPRAVSLPTPRTYSSKDKSHCTSNYKDEDCVDLSRVYASPPPEGPLVVPAFPAPHEQRPRYAHVHPPVPTSKKGVNASIRGRRGQEVVFEQAGSEFTVGIEVALGRAEEGRVIW